MNLVAKEFVAAQDSENPGVLVLSQFAGAANGLDRALIVNPHETDAVAVALKCALEMPLPERRERHATMLRRLMDWDSETWAENYVSTLVKSVERHPLVVQRTIGPNIVRVPANGKRLKANTRRRCRRPLKPDILFRRST
jgi:trehalose 6-phosphate synthase